MKNAIEISGLIKEFRGFRGVDGLDLTVPRGSVFGFLGPNGAGKTTTIRILMGLARPSSGKAVILGEDVIRGFPKVSTRVGYLPENPAFFGWMTARQYLDFCADLFQLKGKTKSERVDYLLEFAGLAGVDRQIQGFSRGMRQRLGLAQALVNDGDVLFLDEPTSALDPLGRKEVLDIIASLGKEKTVFFSTHILADADRVCDRVAVINRGKLVLESGLPELKQQYLEPSFVIQLGEPPGNFADVLLGQEWVKEVKTVKNELTVSTSDVGQAERELPRLIASCQLPLLRFEIKEPELEDIFLKVTRS